MWRKTGVKIVKRLVSECFCDVCGEKINSSAWPKIGVEIDHHEYQYDGDEAETLDICDFECLKQLAVNRDSGRAWQMNENLLPCPFCGGDRPYLSKTLRDGEPDAYAHFVVCHSCACQGGWAKTEGNARRNWNMRT